MHFQDREWKEMKLEREEGILVMVKHSSLILITRGKNFEWLEVLE